jgi:hypothetical protein
LRQIKEIVNLFRSLYKDLEAEKDLLTLNPSIASPGKGDTLFIAEPTNVKSFY